MENTGTNKKKSKSKGKSAARKPLKEVSNGVRFSSRQESNKTKPSLNVVDRLLLVHSDLSNLINQIDQLVVQAVEVDGTSKKGKEEIDLFTNILSDMHSSLKLWIPRFRNLLPSPTVEPIDQLVQSSPIKTFPVVNEETRIVDNSPSPVLSDLDSFVSPSPLVSWCPERTVQSGRQLFLLTPLPRSRQLSSKLQSSSRTIFTRNMDGKINNNLGTPSLLTICQNNDEDLPEGKDAKLTPSKGCQPSIPETKTSSDEAFVSPPKFGNRRRSMLLMTPRLKMSPPKSCVMLEPIKESRQTNKGHIYRKTPYRRAATPYKNHILESSTLKCAEQFGTQQQGYMSKMERIDLDTLFDLPVSPPKSCVLMEPDRKPWMSTKTQTAASTKQTPRYELGSTSKAYLECTPMLKGPESTVRRGKQPGETTLKKELWTRFEAASSVAPHVLQLDVSVLEDTSSKGFLDRLEEVFTEDVDDSGI